MLEKQFVNIGDIDIAYAQMGEGYPLVMIMGYTGSMDSWSYEMLKILATKYKVLVFDNRGMGKSGSSEEEFSIELFVKDVYNLLNELSIDRAHILGFSMGVCIALEFVSSYPEKVNRLMLYAGSCGGKEEIAPEHEVMKSLEDILNISMTDAKKFYSLFFTEDFIKQNRDIHKYMPVPEVIPTQENINKQYKALTGWKGIYNKLQYIGKTTLVVTGKEDIIRPPANALLLANNIPGAWLIQLGGGHGLMWQYPSKLANLILNFLNYSD